MERARSLIPIVVLATICLAIIAPITAYSQTTPQPLKEIVYQAFSDDTKGLLALKKGMIDIYVPHKPIKPSDLQALGLSTTQYRIYTASGGICVMLLNPIADTGPLGKLGIVTDPSGKKHFNPFAIREIRFAFNLLIDRKYIAERIVGMAYPAFVVLSPQLPYYDDVVLSVVKSMGFTPEGNFSYAKKLIYETMEKISKQLAKYGYKLYLKDGKWYFQAPGQQPTCVTIKIATWKGYVYHEGAMRFVAQELEKVGFCAKVIAVSNAHAYRDQKDYRYMHWNIYTFRRVISEDLLPIWFVDGMYWTYTSAALPAQIRNYLKAVHDKLQEEIDKLADELEAAKSLSEMLSLEKKLVKLVMEQSIAIAYVNPLRTIVVSKNVHDAVIGWASLIWNPWLYRVAWTPSGVLRIGFYSSEMNLLRPINPTIAMNWLSTARILMPTVDVGTFPNPYNGQLAPLRATWSIESAKLPATALYFDADNHTWITVAQAEHLGLINATKVAKEHVVKITYNFILGQWQDGVKMKLFDILLWLAWNLDWAKKSGANDKWGFTNFWQHPIAGDAVTMRCIYGIEIVNSTALAVYTSPECMGISNPNILAEEFIGMINFWGPRPLWPWFPPELLMATGYLLINGGPVSHKNYVLAGAVSKTTARIDYGNPECVKDLVAALEIIAKGEYLPPYAKATIELAKKYPVVGTPNIEEAAKALIDFANKYGHLIVSQGPYIITTFKPDKIVYTRFSGYPRSIASFYSELKSFSIALSSVSPSTPQVIAGRELKITVKLIEKVVFPEEAAGTRPAETAYVALALYTPSGKLVAEEVGKKVAPGTWVITLPPSLTATLKPGTYVISILYGVSQNAPLKKIQLQLTVLPPPTPTKTVVKTTTTSVTTTVAVTKTSVTTAAVTKTAMTTVTVTKTVPAAAKTVTSTLVSTKTVEKPVTPAWVWAVAGVLFVIGLGIGIAVGRATKK